MAMTDDPPSPDDRDDRSRRWLGTSALERVQAARVLLIGCGALGNELGKHLALLGLRRLTLVDFDTIEASNLNRCVLFQPADIGRPKAEVLAGELTKRRPDIEIVGRVARVEQLAAEDWDVDLVALCVDDQLARYYCNAQLIGSQRRQPVINGALGRDFYDVALLWPGASACLVCAWEPSYLAQLFAREARRACAGFFAERLAPFPQLSTLASLCAGVMAVEAISLLSNAESQPGAARLIRYELRGHASSLGTVQRNPRCVEIGCRCSPME
jgi:adenylyltransferase/sulfurtransferase